MSEQVDMQTDLEMIRWAGIEVEGEEIPLPLQRLIWVVRTQGARLAWRDMYQVTASQVQNYTPRLPGVKSSESVKVTGIAKAAHK